ncbi:hypothetical protein LZK82_16795 [Rhizobium leguminosarum]|nr:hypothetical protein LZK82_16795 [Rhizobium leguminosarum]UIK09675.1 hypothetical protein LZK80_16925 [Rhizobium leguminosarum]UIL26855.1 hypothetical protein LZK75_16920 [Rhizobium leguminosarum]
MKDPLLPGIDIVVTYLETIFGFTLKITFPDQARQELYNCRRNIAQRHGEQLTRLVCCRLALLRSARSLAEVPVSPPINRKSAAGTDLFTVNVGKAHLMQLRAIISGRSRPPDPVKVEEIQILDIIPMPPGKRT